MKDIRMDTVVRGMVAYGPAACFAAQKIMERDDARDPIGICVEEPYGKPLPQELMDSEIIYVLADAHLLQEEAILQLRYVRESTDALLIGFLLGDEYNSYAEEFEELVSTVHFSDYRSGAAITPMVLGGIDVTLAKCGLINLDAEDFRLFFEDAYVTAKYYSAKGDEAAETLRNMIATDKDLYRENATYMMLIKGVIGLGGVNAYADGLGIDSSMDVNILLSMMYIEKEDMETEIVILRAEK